MSGNSIPVTVRSGIPGAGKTTVLNHLLQESGDRAIAVLINDMGVVNADAKPVAESSDIADADETTEQHDHEHTEELGIAN